MELSLTDAIKKIDNLKRYIELINKMKEFDDLSESDLKQVKVLNEFMQLSKKIKIKKIYDYNLLIITLYGVLESYIEESIKEHLEILNKTILHYKDLPEKIIDNHIAFSANLLKYIDTMGKYEHLKKSDVIKNLNSCLSDFKYTLNYDAYTYHTSNFRYDSINEIYNNIGINGILNEVVKIDDFRNYIKNDLGADDQELEAINKKKMFDKLDDLATRRNSIAHGTISDDLLGIELISNYIEFINALIISINKVLQNKIIYYEFEFCRKEELNKPIKIINNEILCLELNYQKLKIGDKIFAYNKINENIKFGSIISMKIGDDSITETPLRDSIKVGVKVNFKAKENYDYYIVKENIG